MSMKIKIRCNDIRFVTCPRCGFIPSISNDTTQAHCGHCGTVFEVEITEKAIKTKDEAEPLKEAVQMSLFDMNK